MKLFTVILCSFLSFQFIYAQNLKPYTLGLETTESISELKEQLVVNLESNGLNVIGQYQPAEDSSRWVIVFTSPELLSAVSEAGGLTGFGASLRIGITVENGKTLVSYTTPEYWGNAYFRSDFEKVAPLYQTLSQNLENAMKATGAFVGTSFGSKNGLSAKKLAGYRYMMSMPRFDDTIKMAEFGSYQEAINKISTSIAEGVPDVELVYKLQIPDQNLILYGFALSGTEGEGRFLPIIDFGNPKHTAFLPYEILVKDNEVHMLHGRYRIALSFPDLKMRTFSRIMSTPGDIEKALSSLVD